MIFDKELKNFSPLLTKDGSYTLKGPEGCLMHNFGGAVSETQQLYGRALDWNLAQQGLDLKVLSVGLGLGLVEMLVAAKTLSCKGFNGFKGFKGDFSKLSLVSYELYPELEAAFLSWTQQGHGPGLGPKGADCIYHRNADLIGQPYGLTGSDIRQQLKKIYDCGQGQMAGPLALKPLGQKFHTLIYDAYSQKIHLQAWEQDFLSDFVDQNLEGPSVFTSFSCLSRVKRMLLEKGFSYEFTPGYFGKRESLFMARNPQR